MNMQNSGGLGAWIRRVLQEGASLVRSLFNGNRTAGYSDPDIIDMPEPPAVYEEKPERKLLGILMAAAGFGLGGSILFWSLVLLLGAGMVGELGFGFGLFCITLLPVGACVWLGVKGVSLVRSMNRFRIYRRTIGDEELCNIGKLSERVGKTAKYVARDVEKMIQKGWFCQGHLDDKKTCLMLTDNMYREYRKLENERARLEEERRQQEKEKQEREKQEREQKEKQEKQEKQRWRKPSGENGKAESSSGMQDGIPQDVQNEIRRGDEYVAKIRKCNDRIPGELISAKIDRMEQLVRRIYARIGQRPDRAGEIRKLTEYYLPMTIKLLETYAEFEAQPADGENIRNAKKEIEDSLDMINEAFENLLDKLYQDTAWDVSTDISVLKTMLAQEGLNDDGLKNK